MAAGSRHLQLNPSRAGHFHARLAGLVDPLAILGCALFIGLWYVAHFAIARYMPAPHEVLYMGVANLFESFYFTGLGLPPGGYLPHLISTTRTVLIGVAVGGAIGTMTGLAAAESAVARKIMDPIVSILGTVPILVAAPFFLIWFGLAPASKIILVGLYSAVVLHIFAFRSVGHVNPRYGEYARTLGGSPLTVFRRVTVPAVVPELFGGLRTAFGAAWGLAAIAELMGALHGVGRVIIATWGVYDITAMLAGIIWLGIIAMVLDAAIVVARRWVLRWSEAKGD
jgi:ABC-type nitrate/sulfonate/bicarbonate transport system permease component